MKAKMSKCTMKNCQNPYDSYGMICVGCNCCGEIDKETMWQARYELAVRMLRENVSKITDKSFYTRLQQGNICSNIRFWSEELKEIIMHLDFDPDDPLNKLSGLEIKFDKENNNER